MSKKRIIFLTTIISLTVYVMISHLLKLWHVEFEVIMAIAMIISILNAISVNYIFKKYKIAGYDESKLMQVEFLPTTDVADHAFKYAVIMSQYKSKWIFVRHKDRTTWEFPGGRREPNEDIFKTAERELMEETGATQFELKPISAYSVKSEGVRTYGLYCYAHILEFGNPLTMEIVEIKEFDELPDELTYPFIQNELFNQMKLILAHSGGKH